MYGIRCFLCSQIASLMQYSSVGAHLATRCLSQCLGWQELAALKHHATCFQALLGCSLCLPTQPFRPWRGITICNEKVRRIVILNTAPPDFAGEPTSPEHIKQKNLAMRDFFVIPKRFERLTHALEGRCSIQLSYGTNLM